jgi:hypothetical protein
MSQLNPVHTLTLYFVQGDRGGTYLVTSVYLTRLHSAISQKAVCHLLAAMCCLSGKNQIVTNDLGEFRASNR